MTALERQLEASVTYLAEKEKQMNAIEIRKPSEIARTSGPSEWEVMRAQAKTLLDSGFLPKAINTPEKALAVMQTGKELGLAPMQSLRSIHIIEGKPSMSADLMAGLALSRHPGGTLRVAASTNERCLVEAARAGQQVTRFEFTMSDAQRAGLTSKDVWRKYPRAMLRARCLTEAARAVFPDVVAGLYDPDELGGEVALPAGDTGIHSPHGEDNDPQTGERYPDLRDPPELMAKLVEAQSELEAGNWKCARKLIGSKGGDAGEFGRPFSAAKNGGHLSADYSRALGKLWGQLDRKLAKLETQEITDALNEPEPPLEGDGDNGDDAGHDEMGRPL